VVAELAGVGPCHGDILPARPCWASQLRCHLFVQQTQVCAAEADWFDVVYFGGLGGASWSAYLACVVVAV
ncbi:hypothetical protein, partial [Mycobacteroides abscessus]|uniref:hypothetical protein n=1 Tax=Mycobacteroides abscessus TaxID=36809 RepID=UPI001A9759DE